MQKIIPDHIIVSERQSKVMGTWPQAISSILVILCRSNFSRILAMRQIPA